MKNLKFVCASAAVAAMMFMAAPQAQARPQYLKAFSAKYANLKAAAEEKKCGVCHGEGGKNKKSVSDYGKALGAALGEKNVKGEDDIAAALTTAEAGDAGGGKTWKEVLAAGLPPAKE